MSTPGEGQPLAGATASGDIYVDEPKSYPLKMRRRGGAKRHAVWSHLWTEPGNEAALHALAAKLGLRREWFQDKPGLPHYDITEGRVRRAHKMGALRLTLRHWLEWRRRSRPNDGTQRPGTQDAEPATRTPMPGSLE